MPRLTETASYGGNQFAFQEGRGARDVIVLLVMDILWSFDKQLKVGFYCSDVSGAFDKVEKGRIEAKIRATGLHPSLAGLLCSWLEERKAEVVAAGAHSPIYDLRNMIFLGTVLGPILWNIFSGNYLYRRL